MSEVLRRNDRVEEEEELTTRRWRAAGVSLRRHARNAGAGVASGKEGRKLQHASWSAAVVCAGRSPDWSRPWLHDQSLKDNCVGQTPRRHC